MCSVRQQNANVLNAQKSTGPKTEEGKAISRANSYKHGLSGAGVVVIDEALEAREEQFREWRPCFAKELQNGDDQTELLFQVVVVNGLRILQAQRREFEIQADERERAVEFWEYDRIIRAETLGDQMLSARSPGLYVAKLQAFRQGLEWLILQWNLLKPKAARGEAFSKGETTLFRCLIGLQPSLRDPNDLIDPDLAYEAILANLERLEGRMEMTARRDEREYRAAVERGFFYEVSHEERLNRRYESLAQKRFHQARKLLGAYRPDALAEADAPPQPSRPQPKPEVAPTAPSSERSISESSEKQARPSANGSAQRTDHERFVRQMKSYRKMRRAARNEADGAFGNLNSTLNAPRANGTDTSRIAMVPTRS